MTIRNTQIAIGTRAMTLSVVRSNRRCMKYRATSSALATARMTSRLPAVSLAETRGGTINSRMVSRVSAPMMAR